MLVLPNPSVRFGKLAVNRVWRELARSLATDRPTIVGRCRAAVGVLVPEAKNVPGIYSRYGTDVDGCLSETVDDRPKRQLVHPMYSVHKSSLAGRKCNRFLYVGLGCGNGNGMQGGARDLIGAVKSRDCNVVDLL